MSKKFSKWQSKNPESWFSCVPGKNGFLPVGTPLEKLPQEYDIINQILDGMKMMNEEGYLNKGELFDKINSDLPLFDFENITDKQLLACLHRDYCFLAAAYSLEPCHLTLMNSNQTNYGTARDTLPPQLAIPLLVLGKKNNVFPWLDYAYGYGLNNAQFIEGKDPTKFDSYKTVRTFHGNSSEEGFINVHVAMVAQSGELLDSQQVALEALSLDDRETFNTQLRFHHSIFSSILDTLQQMWKASNYKDYLSFRTFIMGQIGNERCYPDQSLKYDLGDDVEYHAFRGETGAQDSMIPAIDSFLELEYPCNKLTEYLYDLRKYRPKDHQEYINFVKENSSNLNFKKYCTQDSNSCLLLLKNLNCLRMFRKKHWNLTKKYIIQNIKHPVATGGTPITTWLPNQLGATLEYMQSIIPYIAETELDSSDLEYFKTIKIELTDHIQTIMDEVNSMQNDFDNQNHQDFLKR